MCWQMVPTPLSRSLRAKVTLGVILPLLIILGAFTAIEYARHRKATLVNLSLLAAQTSKVIENSLQQDMLTGRPEGIQHTLDAIGGDKTIRFVYLLDTSGRVMFASGAEGVGTRLDNRDPTCQPCHRLPAASRPSSVIVTLPDGQRVFRDRKSVV